MSLIPLLALCGGGVTIIAAAVAIYFILKDREK
jgi:hypothetical protein